MIVAAIWLIGMFVCLAIVAGGQIRQCEPPPGRVVRGWAMDGLLAIAAWMLCITCASGADLYRAIHATCNVMRPTQDGGSAGGTGFVFDEDDTSVYVLTNAHVVGHYRQVKCSFYRSGHQSREITGQTVWKALDGPRDIDIAIVSVPKSSFAGQPVPEPIPLKPFDVPESANVISIGCAKGSWPTLFSGHAIRPRAPQVIAFKPQAHQGRSGSAIFSPDGQYAIGLVAWTSARHGSTIAMHSQTVLDAIAGKAKSSTHQSQYPRKVSCLYTRGMEPIRQAQCFRGSGCESCRRPNPHQWGPGWNEPFQYQEPYQQAPPTMQAQPMPQQEQGGPAFPTLPQVGQNQPIDNGLEERVSALEESIADHEHPLRVHGHPDTDQAIADLSDRISKIESRPPPAVSLGEAEIAQIAERLPIETIARRLPPIILQPTWYDDSGEPMYTEPEIVVKLGERADLPPVKIRVFSNGVPTTTNGPLGGPVPIGLEVARDDG